MKFAPAGAIRSLTVLILGVTSLSGADSKAPSSQAQLETRDRQVQELRGELEQSRNQADARIAAVRNGLEAINRGLEARVDQARAEAAAERAIAGDARDQAQQARTALAATQGQLAVAARDRAELTQALGKMTAAQAAAERVAARAVETEKSSAGQLADTSAQLTAVHADTKEAINALSSKTDTQVQAAIVKTAEVQRTIDQQAYVLYGTLGTGFFGLLIAVAGLVARDRMDARHIREIGFVTQTADAVSRNVVALQDDLTDIFPEIKLRRAFGAAPVMENPPDRPKVMGSSGS